MPSAIAIATARQDPSARSMLAAMADASQEPGVASKTRYGHDRDLSGLKPDAPETMAMIELRLLRYFIAVATSSPSPNPTTPAAPPPVSPPDGRRSSGRSASSRPSDTPTRRRPWP